MCRTLLTKAVACISLTAFLFSSPIAAFASTVVLDENNVVANEVAANNLKEYFTYEENGRDLECYVYETETGLEIVSYELMENGARVLHESFDVITDEDGDVWLDDILIYDQQMYRDESGISTAELYPIREYHGIVENSSNLLTALKLGTAFYTTFSNLNPAIGLAVSLFVDIAADFLEEACGKTAYYYMTSRLETFPTDVPPAYTGALTRTDYTYSIYEAVYLTSDYLIGSEAETIYGMPN